MFQRREIKKEKAQINDSLKTIKVKWQSEKELIDKIKINKEKIDGLRVEAEQAEREGKLDRVAEIRYGEIPKMEEAIKKTQGELVNIQKKGGILKEEVTEEDIAKVVSRWTGIPVDKMLKTESQKLVQTENFQSVTGKGVTGLVDGREVALGNLKLFESLGIDAGDLPQQADSQRAEGQTVMFVAVDGKAAGLIGVADPIKASTP